MEIKLTDYIPELEELSDDSVSEVLSRYRNILSNEVPELKTSPNSVFGEFFLKPLAQLVAAFELGAKRFTSDFDMEKVSEGEIYNCDVVKMFLKNLGIQENFSTPAIGTIRINFSENKRYTLDSGSRILFGDEALFSFLTPLKGPIIIDPVGSKPEGGNWKSLVQTDTNTYSVDLTVVGPANVNIGEGSVATTDIPDGEIRNIIALQNFVEGVFSTKVSELASLASKIFNSASLTTRGGATSFLIRQFPYLNIVSPVISGDMEMQRDKFNPLGFSDGRIDIMVKQQVELFQDTYPILVSKQTGSAWAGKITTTEIPSYIDGFKIQEGDASFINPETYDIYGRSTNQKKAFNVASAYSGVEDLGIIINSNEIQIVESANIDNNSQTLGGITLEISGSYIGHQFSSNAFRNIDIIFQSFDGVNNKATAVIKDNITGTRSKNSVFDNGVLDFSSSDEETEILCNGLIVTVTQGWGAGIADKEFKGFTYNSMYGFLPVTYRYDPIIGQVKDLVASPDVQPAIDTLVKSPITCYVNSLKVNYRKKSGTFVDRELAKEEIYKYINSVGYSEAYEQSAIIDILLFSGAIGVQNIETNGIFYPTLANIYTQDKNVKINMLNKWEETKSNTLLPDSIDSNIQETLKENGAFVGFKNIHYIIDKKNIQVNEFRY